MQEPVKFHAPQGPVFIILGVILIAFGMVTIGTIIGNGILLLVLGILFSATPLVELHPNHLEFRVAPIRGKQMIRYADIVRMTEPKPGRLEIETKDAPGRVFKMPLPALRKADRARIVAELRRRQPQAA